MSWLALAFVAGLTGWLWLWRRSHFAWVRSTGRPQATRASFGLVRTVHFPAVDGVRLEGWLFLPDAVASPPIVVMAPGLGGTKDGLLESFAWAFVKRGLAVLAFDYRTFGGSEGLPRHWVAPPRHRQDYEAALDFIKRELRDIIDTSRIALWGSSFSGGTALVTSSRRDDIRAVIVQCPYLQTPPRLQPRGLALARYVLLTTLDMLRIFPPIYVPLFGRPGQWAFATSVENPSSSDFNGPLGSDFWRLLPKPPLGGWENKMLARGLATLDEAIPMNELRKVTCPVLFVAADRDDMVPRAFVEEAHARLRQTSELVSFDCGHFDLYIGPTHAANVERQGEFLTRVLC